MGQCKSMILRCDANQTITSCNTRTCDVLGYTKAELIGQSICILMTDRVKQMHQHGFFSTMKMKHASETKGKLRFTMNSNERCYPIKRKNKKLVDCNMDIRLNDDYSCTVRLTPQTYINPNTPNTFRQLINTNPSFHIQQCKDVICIMMDLANSTEFTVATDQRDSSGVASLYYNIMNIASNIIKEQYYPYAYIHETCGDCLFILTNEDLICTKATEKGASLALDMCFDVTQQVNDFLCTTYKHHDLYMRCGMSMGNVSAGVVDGLTFRVFGSPVNRASRLEGACKRNCVQIDAILYDVLLNIEKYPRIKERAIHEPLILKGFGTVPIDTYSVTSKE